MKSYDIHQIVRLTKLFAENTDNVLLGTDHTNPGVVAGFHLHDELELFIRDLGFTPFGALRTGTVTQPAVLAYLIKPGQSKRARMPICCS